MINKSLPFFLFILSSCSLNDLENYKAFGNLLLGGSNIDVNNELYESIEYAFAKASIGRGDEVILILRSFKEGIYEWISEDGILIYTRHGIIISTIGLEHDMQEYQGKNAEITKDNVLLDNFKNKTNFVNPELYDLELNYHLSKKKEMQFNHLSSIRGHIYEYTKYAPSIKWKSKMVIIYDKDNNVLFSKQTTHPYMDPITLEFYIK